MDVKKIILVFGCICLFFSCQSRNVQDEKGIEIKNQIEIMDTNRIQLESYYDEDCFLKLSKEIEKRIKTVISKERYESIMAKYSIRLSLCYTLQGKILSMNIKKIGFNEEERKLITEAIMKDKLPFACHNSTDPYETKREVSLNDSIHVSFSLPYDPNFK